MNLPAPRVILPLDRCCPCAVPSLEAVNATDPAKEANERHDRAHVRPVHMVIWRPLQNTGINGPCFVWEGLRINVSVLQEPTGRPCDKHIVRLEPCSGAGYDKTSACLSQVRLPESPEPRILRQPRQTRLHLPFCSAVRSEAGLPVQLLRCQHEASAAELLSLLRAQNRPQLTFCLVSSHVTAAHAVADIVSSSVARVLRLDASL